MIKMKFFTIIIAVTAFSSCNKLEIQKSDNNKAVVESYIRPGNDLSVSIRKQLVINSGDSIYQVLNDLQVVLSDGENKYSLNNTGQGLYENPEIEIMENQEYKLEFNYNEKQVSATTKIPAKPENFSASATVVKAFTFNPGSGTRPEMPVPITLSWSNPNEDYFMIVVENTELDPILINTSTDRPIRIFRNTPTQGSSQELPPMSFTYYGQHRVILYKLNAEYAALYEQLNKSSLDIKAPPSNVVNGLGIFTGINSDTLYIQVVSQ
jgi:hypothetical protein